MNSDTLADMLTWSRLYIHHEQLPSLVYLLPLIGILFYVIHAAWLHPLAKYPGPLLARLTQAYDAYHSYKGNRHVVLYRLHEKYGPIVRYSPNGLSINDPSALRAIYQHKNINLEKAQFYKCFRAAPQAVSTLLATDKAQHAQKRRVMGQAFSDQALRDLEPYVLVHVQSLIDSITNQLTSDDTTGWSATLDLQRLTNYLVFDIMGEIVFGKSLGTQAGSAENRHAIQLLTNAARRNYTVGAMPLLASLRLERYLSPLKELYRDRAKYFAFGKKHVMERAKQHEQGIGAERRDIFNFILSAKDPETGEGFPVSEILMEGNTLIVAGSDTTATAMGATLFYLLQNPQTLRKLEHEIRSAFKNSDDIHSSSELHSCTYLRACLDEAMRMTPSVAGLLPRRVLGSGLDIPELNLFIPPGVDVGVCTYSIHHHPDYVQDPFRYDPDRWLRGDESTSDKERNNNEGGEERKALKAIFEPFSLGNRACLGKPLVYMELSLAVARLIFEFDMRLGAEQIVNKAIEREIEQGLRVEGEYHVKDWFLARSDGFGVEFRQREFSAS